MVFKFLNFSQILSNFQHYSRFIFFYKSQIRNAWKFAYLYLLKQKKEKHL